MIHRTAFRGSLGCLLAFAVALSGCGPSATPAPATLTPTATITPTATRTPLPSPTPTATITPTPTPMLAGADLPNPLEVISPYNVARLSQVARWGSGSAQDLAYAPDGRSVAIASPLGVFIYDRAAQLIHTIETRAAVRQVAFSPDGKTLALSAGTVELWDTQTWTIQDRLPVEGNPALALRYSTDGSRLARAAHGPGDTLTLQTWDAQTHTAQPRIVARETGNVIQAELSPDLAALATLTDKRQISLWNAASGERVTGAASIEPGANALAFNPDSSALAVGYLDERLDGLDGNQIRIYRVSDGQQLWIFQDAFTGEAAYQGPLSLAWSPDGQLLAAGQANYAIRVWAVAAGALSQTLRGNALPNLLEWSPDGRELAAGGLSTWDVASGQLLGETLDHYPQINDIAYSPDGQMIAIAGYGRIDFRWSDNGTLFQTYTVDGGPVTSVDYSPDGTALAAGSYDGRVRLWRLSDNENFLTLGKHTDRVWSVAFSPDGLNLASSSEDGMIRVWHMAEEREILAVREPYVAYALAFTPDNTALASLTTNGINLRQVPSGTLLRTFGGVGLSGLSFTSTANWLAFSGQQGARVVDWQTGRPPFRDGLPLEQGPDWVWRLDWTPDDQVLFGGGQDGTIAAWWGLTGSPLASFAAHRGPISALQVAPAEMLSANAGAYLATGGEDGVLRLWAVLTP